jgi:redox-sensitive bicupin YhaK (pirin superfamily)
MDTMSARPDPEESATWKGTASAVATVITPRSRDLGGFTVRRVLPAIERRMVGPFIFFDVMGPVAFNAGDGIDVRPHPHIGLATLTYLFEGEILHRDSLGTVQPIVAGDVNWMTAGRGIVHSERSDPKKRLAGARLSGIQSWIALPERDEETAPAFAHHPAATLPLIAGDGTRVRLIAGTLLGARAPARIFSDMFYADAALAPAARLALSPEHEERALFIVEGTVEIAGQSYAAGQLLVLRPGAEVVVTARETVRLMLLGGAPLDGPRHIWWNFVSSTPERIEAAKADWKGRRFPAVPGETEFTPLPE